MGARAVGKALPHDSAHLHVAGTAAYTDDLPEPRDLLHLAVGLSEKPHARIVGIKEAVRGGDRVDELVSRCPPDFVILSGDDVSCLEAIRRGAAGVISVAANVAPALLQAICSAAAEADWERADRMNRRLEPLFEILAVETNPIPVKWALFEMGLIGPHIRLPMTVLAEEHRQAVRESLADLGLLPD